MSFKKYFKDFDCVKKSKKSTDSLLALLANWKKNGLVKRVGLVETSLLRS
jgi:hypothetical protein